MKQNEIADSESAFFRLSALTGQVPPRASRFIVTLYGDVVLPRGGTLSMASLIACCADQGINESLARTAVSRLVSAGRLEGERLGRKSYYRLTEVAREEFTRAGKVFYSPPPPAIGWLLRIGGEDMPEDGDWVTLGPHVMMAPDRPDLVRPMGGLLSARTIAGRDTVGAFARSHWPLDAIAESYAAFVSTYSQCVTEPAGNDPALALALRLRLVHDYRLCVLSDPRLPLAALPSDWPGDEARNIFRASYLALAEQADVHIGRICENETGPLPEITHDTMLRLDHMRAEVQRNR